MEKGIAMICSVRKGIVDIWNAFMVAGAKMCDEDIPLCPCTLKDEPQRLVSWPEAKRIRKQELRRGNREFHVEALVHFYVDDQKFDGLFTGVWQRPKQALTILEHFDGIVTPDYSIYQDFPKPIKLFNIYRMRAFGYWVGARGLQVVNNVRWGDAETWNYCNSGIPKRSPIFIGAVGSSLKEKESHPLFDAGFAQAVECLEPSAVYFYGSPTKSALALLAARNVPFKLFESDAHIAHCRKDSRNE